MFGGLVKYPGPLFLSICLVNFVFLPKIDKLAAILFNNYVSLKKGKEMKKSILYLLAILFTTCCVTSCGDDDENKTTNGGEETWKELSKTYENDNLKLMMGETGLTAAGKNVKFDAQSATEGKITLTNVLPETASLEITTTMQEADGVYSFTGEAEANSNCKVAVNGTIKDGVLSVVFNRTLSGSLVGDWNLVYANGIAGIYANFVTGSALDQLINAGIPALLGLKLAGKVEAVKVNLPENGIFNVAWRKTGEASDQDLSAVAAMVVLPYTILDGKFVLALDKNYMDLLSTLLGSKLAELGLSMDQMTAMLTDLGGYYGVALNVLEANNTTTFYADKSMTSVLLPILIPIFAPSMSETEQALIDQILPLLPTAEQADLGLTFQKAE